MASKTALTVNDQNEHFCQLYVLYWRPGKAAVEAGYSEKYGYELMKKPEIIDRIYQIQRQTGINMIVDKSKVTREIAYLAYSDITDAMDCSSTNDLKELPENVRRAIRKLKIVRKPVYPASPQGGGRNRRSRGDSGGLAEVRYEEHIEIEMHHKVEPLKLLALITDAINPDDDKTKRPAFTGMRVSVLPPAKKTSAESDD